MIRREDTERAVEILTRYQSTLRSPEEQELKASIGKVSHIFQSELFQALLDIHEFYDFTLRSAPLQSPSLDAHPRQQHGASEPSSAVTPGEPQNLPEGSSWDCERRLPTGTGDSAPGTPPRLVRVTARRTEAPASVCSLVLSSHSTLPQDFMREEGSDNRG
ncbi:disks large homolog 1-like isoform X2 [Empidonax traillii]|uniref:disks large homolog 1-like isoform X2 n=1 Tax=Empidonax traillii TaxID=164674 RepID=UPI000FFCF9CF|nr:disks large homolog 1-like isoform X2 [Empidonax traillii]